MLYLHPNFTFISLMLHVCEIGIIKMFLIFKCIMRINGFKRNFSLTDMDIFIHSVANTSLMKVEHCWTH